MADKRIFLGKATSGTYKGAEKVTEILSKFYSGQRDAAQALAEMTGFHVELRQEVIFTLPPMLDLDGEPL